MGEKEHPFVRIISTKLHPAVVLLIFLSQTVVLGLIFRSFLAASLFMGTIGFGGLVIRGVNKLEERFRRKHPLRCKKSELKKLLEPDWECYREHLGREVPEALQKLYRDEERLSWILIAVPGKDYSITHFTPISKEELLEFEQHEGLPEHPILPLATTDVGDPVYLKPGTTERNAVWIWEHELQECYILAESPEEFIAMIFPETIRAAGDK